MKRYAEIWFCLLLGFYSPEVQSQTANPELDKNKLISHYGLVYEAEMDTSISGAQVFHPQYKYFPSWSELGNMGLPALPNYFTGIGPANTPSILKPFLTYLHKPEEIYFYDVKVPYSSIKYNSGGSGDKNGQNLGFLYTRNFGSDINIAGAFDFISSAGHYKNQASIVSTINLDFALEKKRYRHYANIERIQFKLQENGGVANDDDVFSESYPELVRVNLSTASSKTGIVRLKGWQYFDLFLTAPPDSADSTAVYKEPKPGRPVLIHRYNYTSANRIYKDVKADPFYTDIFLDSIATLDSIQHFSFENDINARVIKYFRDSASLTVEAGLHHELLHFYSFENPSWKQRLGTGGMAMMETGKFAVRAHGNFIFAGFGAGDYELVINAGLNRNNYPGWPEISFGTMAASPDMYVMNFTGNHFKWSNDFVRQFGQQAGIRWKIPRWKLSLYANAYLVNNWIYFDTEAKPAQMGSSALVASAGLEKLFKAGPLRSNNKVYMNVSAAEAIPLPLIAASSSTFLHHDIRFPKTHGFLQLEYGFDVRYTYAFPGYSYMPATAAFHLQNERILGNYPFIDLFLIMRVKRTRFFIKWDHVNGGFMGDNIFPVLHFPSKQRYLKYGVFWHFYD